MSAPTLQALLFDPALDVGAARAAGLRAIGTERLASLSEWLDAPDADAPTPPAGRSRARANRAKEDPRG